MSITGLVGGQSLTVTAVGNYHSIDDVADHFGADNCCIWMNMGPSDTGDTVDDQGNVISLGTMSRRAAGIIKFTESWVNSWFRRSRYLVPFTPPTPEEVIEICAHLTGSKAYEPRTVDDIGDGVAPVKTFVMAKRKEAIDMIKTILTGKMEIAAALDPGITEAPALVRFDRMRMRQVRNNELDLDWLSNITLNSDGVTPIWPG
jgi:hypothetical protein